MLGFSVRKGWKRFHRQDTTEETIELGTELTISRESTSVKATESHQRKDYLSLEDGATDHMNLRTCTM